MFETRADIELNYLLIAIGGRLERADAEALVARFTIEAKKLRAGFTIINDLTTARPGSEELTELMRRGQRAMFLAGARRVIRVIAEGSAALCLQFSRTQREGRAGYEARTVSTMAEALRLVALTK